VLGHVDPESSPGAIVFTRDGKTLRLDAVLERGETDYFVIFGDRPNSPITPTIVRSSMPRTSRLTIMWGLPRQ
jgi:uncharacterized protein (DUF1684 family)